MGKMGRVRLKGSRYVLRSFLGTLTSVKTEKPVVSLTFDDGPHPDYTPWVLDVLAKYKAQATFFVVGNAAKKHPEILVQIQEAGHTLGNHSWGHPSFVEISAHERKQQISMWEDVVGVQPLKLFRPPYGHQTNQTRLQLRQLGYKVVGWGIDIQDWLPLSADDVVERLCRGIEPGTIILLHDAIANSRMERPELDRSNMIAGLDKALAQLHTEYQFLTVPQLLTYGRSKQVIWEMGEGK